MWKLRIGALATSGALALGLSSGAWADGGAGDVWLGNAGQPPAHSTDPRGSIEISSVTTTWTGSVETSIGAIATSRQQARTARKAHKVARSKRRRKVHMRHVKAV